MTKLHDARDLVTSVLACAPPAPADDLHEESDTLTALMEESTADAVDYSWYPDADVHVAH